METLMFALFSWIVANSSYTMPSALPAVEYREQMQMRRMFFCEDPAQCDEAKLPHILIAAIYEHKTRSVYLPNGFDPRNLANQATLVHELTHHLQELAGKFKNIECFGPLEYEAYRIEDRWLASQGLPVPEKTPARMLAGICNMGPT